MPTIMPTMDEWKQMIAKKREESKPMKERLAEADQWRAGTSTPAPEKFGANQQHEVNILDD